MREPVRRGVAALRPPPMLGYLSTIHLPLRELAFVGARYIVPGKHARLPVSHSSPSAGSFLAFVTAASLSGGRPPVALASRRRLSLPSGLLAALTSLRYQIRGCSFRGNSFPPRMHRASRSRQSNVPS